MTPFEGAPKRGFTFAPIDHDHPDLGDVARRTHVRSVLAHMFTMLVFGGYLVSRIELESRAHTSGGGQPPPVGWLLAIVVPIVAIRFVVEVLRWRAFTFRVNEHRLVIDKGVLTRHHIVIPFDRVQQVDIHRRFTAMILGLAAVRIDTAGMGQHTAVQLRYLDPASANGLRAFILSHRDARAEGTAAPAGTTVPAPPEQELLAVGFGRLVLAAVTHHFLVITLPTMLLLTVWAGSIASISSRQPLQAVTIGIGSAVFGLLFLIVAAQTLVGTIVRNWAYTLSISGDDLHLRFGLTDQRHLTVPRRRIQHVEVVDNPLRRAFGLVEVHLHTAASIAGAGSEHRGTKFEIPVLRRDELAAVLPHLLADPELVIPPLTPRPAIARRRAVARRVAAIAVALSLPAVALGWPALGLLVLALAGIPWGLAAHRRAGHARTASFAIVGHGVLHHRVTIVPLGRTQSARTSASPFQRRAGLRTIHLDVARAQRAPTLFDMDAEVAARWRTTLGAAPAAIAPEGPRVTVSA